jgi:hypothetical protein
MNKINNTNESFRGSQMLSSFFSFDKLRPQDHQPATRRVLGREGWLDDSKPTRHESIKLVNNDTLHQVQLKNDIKAAHYRG